MCLGEGTMRVCVTGAVFFLGEFQHPSQIPQTTLTKHGGFTWG